MNLDVKTLMDSWTDAQITGTSDAIPQLAEVRGEGIHGPAHAQRGTVTLLDCVRLCFSLRNSIKLNGFHRWQWLSWLLPLFQSGPEDTAAPACALV